MNSEQVFSICSAVAALQWLVLLFIPKSKFNKWLMRYALIPAMLSIIYCVYISSFLTISGGGYNNLHQVHQLFLNDNLLLAGWVHYLAFDLLTGFAIVKAAQDRHIPHLLIAPCLVLTFLFGPAGFLLFQIIKIIKKRNEKLVS